MRKLFSIQFIFKIIAKEYNVKQELLLKKMVGAIKAYRKYGKSILYIDVSSSSSKVIGMLLRLKM